MPSPERLAVDLRCVAYQPDLTALADLADAVVTAELGRVAEVSLVLTDDADIAELNLAHLGHEGPTDVISFPQYNLRPDEPAQLPEPAILGDIVISVETAAAQAAEFADWSTDDEVALLLVHGLLHLCGWDDLEPAARQRMQAREDELLVQAGRPPAPRGTG